MQKIRWGIIGCGKIAAKMAEAINQSAEGTLLAVGSRNKEKASAFAERHGAQNSYDSYEALVQDPAIDIVYIATPHHLHTAESRRCLEAGKAVLCEKPFAMNPQEAKEVFALAKQKDLFIMEALWTRFIPSYTKALALSNSGRIGDLTGVIADFGFKAQYHPDSRLFDPALGGGALLDIGIYPVFLAYTVLGMPDEIQSMMNPAPTGVDAQCSIAFCYNSGLFASLTASFKAHHPREAWIIGTEGRIKIHQNWHEQSRLTIYDNAGNEEAVDFSYTGNGFDHELAAVHKALLNNERICTWWSPQNSLDLSELLHRVKNKWS